mmetsp:Transcript_37708/g.106551  ORF Transcript_37708/g.106551 Transcript_37708/m.106551 type:complete len:110 (+) Transcript_37708:657-986(+)
MKAAGSMTVPWSANQLAATAEMFPEEDKTEASTLLQEFMNYAFDAVCRMTPHTLKRRWDSEDNRDLKTEYEKLTGTSFSDHNRGLSTAVSRLPGIRKVSIGGNRYKFKQ